MNRRIRGLASVVLLCAAAGLAGCEPFQHNLRPRSQDDADIVADSHDKADESSEPSPAKGFFKSSRLSGAMSSEGREIEQSLGIR